jgi:DNA repair protein RecN (Recombination protein N)
LLAEYQEAYRALRSVESELAELRDQEAALREKQEFSLFQMQDIDAVSPQAGEEEALEQELRILENAEKLYATTTRLYETLYEGEQSVHDLLVIARNQLQDLATIDRQFTEAAAECTSAETVVGELARFIQRYNAGVEFNPERLEEIRQRLSRLALLKKKYGGTLDAVIAHREAIGRDAAIAENFDAVIGRLAARRDEHRTACGAIAGRLSAKRHDTARKVDGAVVQELARLGIPRARFTTRITRHTAAGTDGAATLTLGNEKIALHDRGYDDVEFFLSTNLGEEERPLARVASGGEVSRIMLALKSILAKSDRLPVLIFDEIDVGVSGRIARAVGVSLKNLSAFHQIIAITHLPQIAGLADAHFAVSKQETNGRTASTLRRLSLDDQVREVARLLSGAEVTEAGLAGARELMGLSSRSRTS